MEKKKTLVNFLNLYTSYQKLGNGYELRPIEILSEGGQYVLDNKDKYSHLYHNNEKISDKVFRKGGLGGEFKGEYCCLIYYIQEKEHTEKRLGFNFGTHVIINSKGDIVLEDDGMTGYPSIWGGHVGSRKDTFYDLRTSKPIMVKSSTTINSKNNIIVDHKYDWYNKENLNISTGVYMINKETCEITKIDDVGK